MKKTLLYFSLFVLSTFISSAQSIKEARKLTDNEQYEESSAMYEKLIGGSPAEANLYYFFGDNLLSSDNADSAQIVFEKGKSIDPNNALLKIGAAKLLLDALGVRETKAALEKDGNNPELRARNEDAVQNVAQAGKLIDEAVAKAPLKDPLIYIEAAEAYIHYKNKDLDKAKLLLDKASGIDPKNIEINLLYGDIYAELVNGTLSADYYNKALELDKTSVRAIVSKGRLYKRSTNYEGAAEEFQRAVQIDSSYAPAHRELGEAYFKLGKLEKAKAEYRKYLELSKNNCGARIRYASFLYISKSYSEALSELASVAQRCDSNNLTMLRIQSYSYYEEKNYEQALGAIEHLFRIVPMEKRLDKDFEYYGKTLMAQNKDSLGIEQLQKAFAIDPNRVDLLSEIAGAWFKLKQYPNSILFLQQKISQGKDVKVADYYNLGRSYYYNNQFPAADSAFMKVNELSSKYASGWLWRADANSHIDSTSEAGLAKPFYEKYVELAEADSENASKYSSGLIKSYGYLAYYYILKKDNANALLYLKKKQQLSLDPEDKKNVDKAIDQLEHPTPKGK